MATPLNVLILDDRTEDAELLVHELRRAGYIPQWVRVETQADFLAHLDENIEVILADYSMPEFDIPRALDLLHERGFDIPVIVVTGSVTELVLEETLRRGAVDYLIKDRLARLGPAVSHVIDARKLRKEKRQAEDALRQSEKQYRLIVETAEEGIWVSDSTPKTTFVNSKMAEMLGYSVEEMHALQMSAIVDNASQETAMKQLEALSAARSSKFDLKLCRKDGSVLWGLVSATILRDEADQPAGIVAMVTDITDRKHAEAAEHEQRVMAEVLRETASTLLSTLDPQVVMSHILENIGRVLPHNTVNIILIDGKDAYAAYWRGYNAADEAFLKALRIPFEGLHSWREMIRTGEPYLISDTTTDPYWVSVPGAPPVGSYIAAPVQVHGHVIGFLDVQSDTPGFFTRDHIARIQTFSEQAAVALQNAQLYDALRQRADNLEVHVEQRTTQLRQVKEWVEAILNNSSDGIAVTGVDGFVEQVNPAFEKMFGIDALDESDMVLIDFADAADAELLSRGLRDALIKQEPQRIEITARSKTGQPFAADVALAPITIDGYTQGIVCSVRDISNLKQIEADLRKSLEAERELNDLKTRFISMASHEFRTPLATIQITSDALRHHWEKMDVDERAKRFDRIHGQIQHMTVLLDDVLTIGRSESGLLEFVPVTLDLSNLCLDVIDQFRQNTPSHELRFIEDGTAIRVQGDIKLLRQAITNLIGNAIKYSAESSVVNILLSQTDGQISVCVQDQGIGIPTKDMKHLFEPFHRSSNVGAIPGSGLGLAIVKQAIDLHEGEIHVESEIGAGSTFTIVLPAGESR